MAPSLLFKLKRHFLYLTSPRVGFSPLDNKEVEKSHNRQVSDREMSDREMSDREMSNREMPNQHLDL